MIRNYLPTMYQESIFTINYDKLRKNKIRCLLFDLDNTISPAKESVYCKKTKILFEKLKKDFKIIIFSNNFPKRIHSFADFYDVDCACVALKPLSFKYRIIAKKHKFKKDEIAAIGDQLLTDIKGGNNFGITTILVNPISEIDEKETWINRKLENFIFKKFKCQNLFIKGKYYD
ncbi:MAG: HAD hydrolase-like protein [Bacilli bacterium]